MAKRIEVRPVKDPEELGLDKDTKYYDVLITERGKVLDIIEECCTENKFVEQIQYAEKLIK